MILLLPPRISIQIWPSIIDRHADGRSSSCKSFAQHTTSPWNGSRISLHRVAPPKLHPPVDHQEIRSALASLDLNFQAAHVDSPGGEIYLVGNEIGLSGRFVNNVCNPVAKILSHAAQPAMIMGDIQAFESSASDVIPDVSIGVVLSGDVSQAQVKIVGEFKTYWTVALDRFSLSNPVTLPQFLPHLGMCNEP